MHIPRIFTFSLVYRSFIFYFQRYRALLKLKIDVRLLVRRCTFDVAAAAAAAGTDSSRSGSGSGSGCGSGSGNGCGSGSLVIHQVATKRHDDVHLVTALAVDSNRVGHATALVAIGVVLYVLGATAGR